MAGQQSPAEDAPRPTGSPGARPVRVLLLTTRDIGERSTGRIIVLRTHVDALIALGAEVTVAVVSPRPPGDNPWTRRLRTEHVRSPRLLSTAAHAARALTVGDRSLNECLFVDRSVRRQVLALVRGFQPDLVLVDSLRLFPATEDVGVPLVVDLDDLLDLRYDRLRTTAREDPVAVLGFAATRVPALLRGAVARVAVRLLGWEARRTASRELAVCASATAVSLVSRHEVAVLEQRSGRDVAWLPPAVPVPDEPVEQSEGLVFLGGLDYLPNLQALRFYRDEVLPGLDAGDPRHVLHVVGHCPDAARAELEVPGMVLHGFVDDLQVALGRTALVAPLVAGGGVKLKVLDAMAHGLPVLGTPGAFEGLGLPDDVRLEAGSGSALAALVREVVADPARCRAVGLRSRAAVAASFSADSAARRWADLLAAVVPARE